jgi:hypothetical protein
VQGRVAHRRLARSYQPSVGDPSPVRRRHCPERRMRHIQRRADVRTEQRRGRPVLRHSDKRSEDDAPAAARGAGVPPTPAAVPTPAHPKRRLSMEHPSATEDDIISCYYYMRIILSFSLYLDPKVAVQLLPTPDGGMSGRGSRQGGRLSFG